MDITDFEHINEKETQLELKTEFIRRVTIFRQVKELLIDKLGVLDSDVTLNSHIMNDLGADSLDGVEIIMEIEKLYNIGIPDDEAEFLYTVQDIVDYLIRQDVQIQDVIALTGAQALEKAEKPPVQQIEIDHSNDKWLAPIEVQERLINPRKKFVTEIRRFELKENWTENDVMLDNLSKAPNQTQHRENIISIYGWAVGLKGDILEEVIDRPNTFINVTKLKRENTSANSQTKKMYLSHYINTLGVDNTFVREEPFYKSNPNILELQLQNNLKLKKTYDNLRPLNPVQAKDSELLNDLNYNLNSLRNSYKRKLKTLAQLNEDITDMEGIFGIEK